MAASNRDANSRRRPGQPLAAACLAALALCVGCHQAGHRVVEIAVGEGAEDRLLEALIMAQPGDEIVLAEGRFDCQGTLSMQDIPRVTIRGQGPDKTVLSFKNQQAGTGGEGLAIMADDVLVADLAIEDTLGDALKVSQSDGVTIRNVRTEWTGGPKETNGGYGVYPVESANVLIEDCVAIGASDSGIYVGQSTDVVVRRNRTMRNVAGIEIENCRRADVYENKSTDNAGGILIFNLPNLPAGPGSVCRVYDNEIVRNNHDNFAPQGNIVGMVPPGTGMMIMAFDQVEVFRNTFRDNGTANLAIFGYDVTQKYFVDEDYDPYCEAIDVHGNTFHGGGDNPRGKLGTMLGPFVGGKFPDIVYGGIVDENKLVDGQLPEKLRIAIRDNGDADFANLDLAHFDLTKGSVPKIQRDLAPHNIQRDPLPPVKLRERATE